MSSQITFPITAAVDSTSIELHAGVDCFTIHTTDPAGPVEGWTAQYPKTRTGLQTAIAEASRTLAVFTAHGSVEGINRRRQQLIADRDQTERRHLQARTNTTRAAYRAILDDIDTELDTLDDLWTRTTITAARAA